MSQDGELRPYLGSLLSGSLLGPGLLAETVRDVAADPNTADQVVDVLDLTDPAEELRLTELLLGNASAHVALADHLRACDRRSAGERAEALVRLAETTSDLLLPQVLEQFGLLESSVRVPPALRARFAKQIARAAGESALDRGEAGNLSDAFSLLVSHGDDAWLDVIDERRVAMLAPQGSGDRRMWDLVPEDFGPGISELTDRQRDEALPRIAQWHEETEHDAYGWRVELGLADLLPRVGANRPGLVAVLARWYALGGHARARTLHMVSTLYARGALEPVLEELLAVSTTADDEELIAALSVPPMSWVGDLEEEYSGRATFFARPRRGNSRARSFAAKAETHFGGLAEAERLRTRKRHEGYDD
jgi:hypothetical protein